MKLDGVVVIDSESGIPLFSQVKSSIPPALFSGFMKAIQNFSKDIALGGLSSFTTEENRVFLAVRSFVDVAVITPRDEETEVILSLAYQLGEAFEKEYPEPVSHDVSLYKGFGSIIDDIVMRNEQPFLVRVAIFAQKEMGGNISVQPLLRTQEGEDIQIDVVVDFGERRDKGGIGGRIIHSRTKAFSKELTFIKVVDGTAGRGEVIEFIETVQRFGTTHRAKGEEGTFPFFPSRAAIVARDFSPTVFEELEKLEKIKGKTFVAPSYAPRPFRHKRAPMLMKCLIELWKWHDSKYPERIFD